MSGLRAALRTLPSLLAHGRRSGRGVRRHPARSSTACRRMSARYGLPTASVVPSLQATPARRRGRPCVAALPSAADPPMSPADCVQPSGATSLEATLPRRPVVVVVVIEVAPRPQLPSRCSASLSELGKHRIHLLMPDCPRLTNADNRDREDCSSDFGLGPRWSAARPAFSLPAHHGRRRPIGASHRGGVVRPGVCRAPQVAGLRRQRTLRFREGVHGPP